MSVEFRRLNHLTVNAPSGEQEKVRWFYCTLLGLKEVPRPGNLDKIYEIMWFQLCDFLFHIEFVKDFTRPPVSYEKDAILPGRHIALEVKNIHKVRQLLTDAKLTIYEAVTLADRDRFYVLDPFGNFFELIEFHANQERS